MRKTHLNLRTLHKTGGEYHEKLIRIGNDANLYH